MLAVQLMSSYRYWIIMREFTPNLKLIDAHRINIKSLVASHLFFNFFGQVFARATLTKNTFNARSVAALVTSLERACGFGTLIILIISLGFWVTEYQSFLFQDNFIIFLYLPIILFLLSLIYYFKCGFRMRRSIRALASRSNLKMLGLSLVITLTMHFVTLMCYMLLISNIYNFLLDHKALLASLVTMVTASLPIVSGGWGIRETAAMIAFSQAGFDTAKGLAVGLSIGVSSVVALAIHTIWIGWNYFLTRKSVEVKESSLSFQLNISIRKISLNLVTMIWFVPIIISVLLLFQIRIYSGGLPAVSLNLADPFAIVMALSAVLFAFKKLLKLDIWIYRGFSFSILFMGLSILISYFVGYWRHGFIEWALFNRLIGFGIILSFFLSGAFLTHMNGNWAIRKILDILLFTSALIVLMEFIISSLFLSNLMNLFNWQYSQYSGFLLNRNAWAFFLLIVTFAWIGFHENPKFNIFLGLTIFGVYATNSRMALIVLIICFLILSVLDFKKFITVMKSTILVFILYYVIDYVIGYTIENLIVSLFDNKTINTINNINILDEIADRSTANSLAGSSIRDYLRFETLSQGWRLFVENPFWGAGLGRNMQLPIGEDNIMIVIHNSFLWVLAEFGVFGFLLFFAPFIHILVQFFRQKKSLHSAPVQALFFCLIIFCTFSLAHEISYQRIFWFMLGLFTAHAGALRCLRQPKKKIE